MFTKKNSEESEETKSIKETPIRMIRVYQAVSFEKQNETTFIVKGTQRKRAVNAVIDSEMNGVVIRSNLDHIFVPMTNISAIYFETEVSNQKIEDDKNEADRIVKQSKKLKDETKKPR